MWKKLLKPVEMPHWALDLLAAVPRVICGYLLAADFGASKFGLPWSPEDNNLGLFEVAFWFPSDVAEFGGVFAMFPIFFAWMGAFSEAIGGLFLILGLQTRVFSFLLICTMLVAMFGQQWGNGMWNMLPAMGFLWVGIYQFAIGSGKFGLDYFITTKFLK